LAAERSYYDQQMAHTAAARSALTAEMSARVAPDAESPSWRRGSFAYFTRNVAGLEYEQFCRVPAGPAPAAGAPPAEVLLDVNLLLEDPECGGGTWSSVCARSAPMARCSPTRSTSTATRSTSCASGTWPAARTW